VVLLNVIPTLAAVYAVGRAMQQSQPTSKITSTETRDRQSAQIHVSTAHRVIMSDIPCPIISMLAQPRSIACDVRAVTD